MLLWRTPLFGGGTIARGMGHRRRAPGVALSGHWIAIARPCSMHVNCPPGATPGGTTTSNICCGAKNEAIVGLLSRSR